MYSISHTVVSVFCSWRWCQTPTAFIQTHQEAKHHAWFIRLVSNPQIKVLFLFCFSLPILLHFTFSFCHTSRVSLPLAFMAVYLRPCRRRPVLLLLLLFFRCWLEDGEGNRFIVSLVLDFLQLRVLRCVLVCVSALLRVLISGSFLNLGPFTDDEDLFCFKCHHGVCVLKVCGLTFQFS